MVDHMTEPNPKPGGDQQPDYDLIIVGAGPAGISMAVEASSRGIPPHRILVLEKGDAHSWCIRKLYPQNKLVEANYKGKPAVCHGVLCISDQSKQETISYLDRAIEEHRLEVRYREAVHSIQRRPDGCFDVHSERDHYVGRVACIAIGIMGRPNKPAYRIPPKLKRRVHFDVTSQTFEGQDLLVVGGGDSASEYVQYLVQCGNKLTLSYRRDHFHRMTSLNRESLLALANSGQVTLLLGTDIEALSEPEDQAGSQVRVHFTGARPALCFDRVVYALGGTTPTNFLQQVGIEFDGKHPRVTRGYETNIDGLYVIGDLNATGGSIILAFNTARDAMQDICTSHLTWVRSAA